MHTRRLLAPSIILAMLTLGTAAPAVAVTPPSPTGFDCGLEAHSYPDRWQAEGATFLGRVVSVHKNADELRVYRLSAQKVFAGDIGTTIRVRPECVTTKLRLGERYLISSGAFSPQSGRIDRVTFISGASVGWHVADDGAISLLGYGPGTPEPPKPYLTKPDTVWEAAHAVALGIQEEAKCVGGEDNIRARWHMEVDRIHGELQVVVYVDSRPDRHWTVELFHDYQPFLHQQRIDSFEIVRRVEDRPGTDRIGFKAVQADGQVCRGVINF